MKVTISAKLYNLTTDNNECRLFIEYRSDKVETKTGDYNSWAFTLTKRDKSEIKAIIDKGHNLVLALVCGVEELGNSELVLLDKEQVKKLLDLGKESMTVSRKKHEKAYRISIGGGRENAMQVAVNRFDELF